MSRAKPQQTKAAPQAKQPPQKPKTQDKTQESKSEVSVEKAPVKVAEPPKEVVKEAPKEEVKDSKSSEEVVEKKRNPRKKVTQASYGEKLKETIDLLEGRIEDDKKNQQKVPRELRKVLKNLKMLEKDAPKLSSKRGRKVDAEKTDANPKTSGFVLKCNISEELRVFLGLTEAKASRKEVTNAICTYIKLKEGETRKEMLQWKHLNPDGKRDLQDPNDKMKVIPDEKLARLLNYDKYKKDVAAGLIKKQQKVKGEDRKETVVVSDPSLRYCDIQRLIKQHFVD